jgi:hypothetical protein
MSMLLEMAMRGEKPAVTGTLLFRDAVVDKKLPQGKKLMLVVGVISVDENFPIEPESQARIIGCLGAGGEIAIAMSPAKCSRIDQKYGGWTIDDLLREPIWRA